MIIRFTVNDNDYKEVIEKFFNKGLYLMLCYVKKGLTDSEQDMKLYVRYSTLIDKYCKMIQDEKIFNVNDANDLCFMLKDAFNKYLEEKDFKAKDYLKENLDISIVDSVKDKWENGEVLYFFPMHDKYIIM